MKKSMKYLLRNADPDSVERMARLCPMTDDATKERIFREVQKRTERPAHLSPAPQEKHASDTRNRIEWESLFSALAACVTLIGTTAGCLYLAQHKPPVIEPGTSVEQTMQSHSLQAVNEQNMPWKHQVVQEEHIGSMELEKVFPSALTSADENGSTKYYDMLTVKYTDPDAESRHGVVIEYSLLPAERFWSVQDGFTFELEDNGHFSQTVDCGGYRVSAEGYGMTGEELSVLLDALKH